VSHQTCVKMSLGFIAVVALVAGAALPAWAADYTWNGLGGNDNWSTGGAGGNWSGSAAPGSNTGAVLHFAGSTRTSPNQDIANPFYLYRLEFASGAASFTLGGNQLNFTGGSDCIIQNSSNAQIINNNMDTSACGSDDPGLQFSGSGTGAVTLNGNISGTKRFKMTGSGYTLILTGNNTQAGSQIDSGTLLFGSDTALGDPSAGWFNIYGGTIGATNGPHTITNALTHFQNGSGLSIAATSTALTLASATIDNSGGETITVNSTPANLFTMSGKVTGNELIKAGTGTMRLTNATSTFSQLIVNAGVLEFTSIANKNVSAPSAIGQADNEDGRTQLGAGTLRYVGTDSGGHSSNRVIKLIGDGTIEASGVGTLTLTGGVIHDSSTRNLTLGGTGAGIESGVIGTGSGTVTKTGNGTWTLSNTNNTYNGATAVNGGTLRLGATNAVRNAVTINSATLDLGAYSQTMSNTMTLTSGSVTASGGTLSFNTDNGIVSTGTSSITGGVFNNIPNNDVRTIAVNSGSLVIDSQVTNSGRLTKTGTGLLSITSAATNYTGDTYINGGTFRIPLANLSGGGLKFGSNEAVVGSVLESSGSFTRSTNGGAGGVTWTPGSAKSAGGFSAYGSKLTVNLGGDLHQVRFSNSDFVTSGYALIFGSPTANAEVEFKNPIHLADTTQTITVNSGTGGDFATLSGALTNGGLTKEGNGTLALSNTNTYTGATDIKAGMILVKVAGALPSSSTVTVRSGATLAVDTTIVLTKTATWDSGSKLGGSGTYDVASGFTPPSGVHIAPGLSVGTLTVDELVNLASGGILDIQVDGATADKLQVTGNLTLGGTSVLNVTEINPGTFTSIAIVTYAGSLTGTFAPANTHLPPGYSISYATAGQIRLLPEPATMALLAIGGLGMLIRRRRHG